MNILKNNRTIHVFKVLLYILCFTLPLFIPNWHGKILVGFSIVWILMSSGAQIKQVMRSNVELQLVFILFLVSLLGLLLSVNTKAGLATIESIAPLLMLPLIIFSSEKNIDDQTIPTALICLVAGVITLNLASLAFISYDLWDPKNLQSNIILANNSIVQIHPAFVSLYLSFCIFFLVDRYFPLQTANRSKLGWILFSLVILVTYLVWINSRTGILSFCLAFIFYSFYRFKSRAKVIALSILAIFFIIIYSVPFSHERFFHSPQQVLMEESAVSSQDPNIYTLVSRKHILECSIEILEAPEFFYGYGTGDFRDVLRDCFKDKNYTSLYNEGLDSHNEYFAQMHRHGIIGLFLFVSLLVIPFHYALKYKSPLLAVFIILFSITALFENVFSAQKGVTFFALFCPLLMLYARKNFESNTGSNQPV